MKKGIGVLLVMLILVGCSVAKENTGESSNEEQFSQMVGDWAIDFERTDPTIWGTVYWKRDVQSEEEVSSENLSAEGTGVGICEIMNSKPLIKRRKTYEETICDTSDINVSYISSLWQQKQIISR